jgi:hypothetical protein
MYQNYDKISRWNENFNRIYMLWKKIKIQQWFFFKCDILGQLCVFLITSCERFHSKILSYEEVKND